MLGNRNRTRLGITALVALLGLIVVFLAAILPGPGGFSKAEAGVISTTTTVTSVNVCPNPSGSYTNIVVRAGQFCSLVRATVAGNILVQPGGRLDVVESQVSGNVSATQPSGFNLNGTTVGGNVSVQNAPKLVELDENQIGGSVSLNGNTGGVIAGNNVIAGILSCQGNNPPPSTFGNTAARFVGQCTN